MSYSTSNSAYGGWNQNPPYGYSQPNTQYTQAQSNVRLTGLINLGNTCYMNSILQALFDVITLNSKNPQSQPITYLYSKLQQTHSNNDYIEFKKYLGSKLQVAAGGQQQDAHEFLAGLLEVLNRQNQKSTGSKPNFKVNKNVNASMNWGYFCDEMRKVDNSQIIDIFGGEFFTELRCPLNHEEYLFQRFLHVSVPIFNTNANIYHIQRLLTQNFKEQTIEDVRCDRCNQKTRRNKRSVIYNPPKVLVIQLKRFAQGFWSNSKINSPIAFNEILELKNEYIHPDTVTLGSVYDLYAVVHHKGSLNGGHYYTQKKIDNQWYLFNDLSVSYDQVLSINNVSDTAYMFFFKLRD